MQELYQILGWQGGTIHQVIEEIKRLKAVESASIDFASEVAFAEQLGQIKKCNKGIADKGRILANLVK